MKFKFTLQLLLLCIVILNGSILFMISYKSEEDPSTRRMLNEMTSSGTMIYRFEDPVTSFQVLEQLDIFEQTDFTPKELTSKFGKPYMGMVPDNSYCKKHRALMVNNPEIIFTQKNIITSLINNSLLRYRVIPAIGTDVMPGVFGGAHKRYKGRAIWELRTDVNNYFTFFGMYGDRAIGHQYSCLSQSSNAIPGHQFLFRKDYISEGVVKYAKSYENKTQCFNYDKFFPETYILYHEDACRQFFKLFNSEYYQQLKKERGGIVYMRKIGVNVHQGMGVFPIDDKEESVIKRMYENGDLCGKKKDNNIIQYYIYNPLLLFGHKFDFRIYMLIASTNPVIAYYYDGFLRVSLHEYKPDSNELGALLTNTALSKSAFGTAAKNGTYKGMTEAELKDFHLWNFQRLENYLYDNGIVTDRNWLDNYLRPEFRKALAHLVRMSQKPFMKKSSVYHLFGMDFMLDANLNLWFIEANASPALEGFSKEMKDHVATMLIDHFEIVFGLMRSRMKRVVLFVNNLIRNGEYTRFSENDILINNLAQKREEFRKLTMNYYEPEFEPSSTNKFQYIINENLPGKQKYFGLIKEECL